MTKDFIILILTCITLCSCQTNDVKTNEQTSTNTDSIQKAFYNKFRQDSIECQDLTSDSIQINGLFKAACPSSTTESIPFSSNKTSPFDTLITKTKDTLFYSFKVSNECCVRYYGKYFLNSDTLILTYGYCGDVCDCTCDYTLTYKIPTKKYKFKHVVISFVDKKHSGHAN